jgi:hypothetical protein
VRGLAATVNGLTVSGEFRIERQVRFPRTRFASSNGPDAQQSALLMHNNKVRFRSCAALFRHELVVGISRAK